MMCLDTLQEMPHIDFQVKKLVCYFEIILAHMWDIHRLLHLSMCSIYETLAGEGLMFMNTVITLVTPRVRLEAISYFSINGEMYKKGRQIMTNIVFSEGFDVA